MNKKDFLLTKDDPKYFSLDSSLKESTFLIKKLDLSLLLLNNDANYPWLILVPQCAEIKEIFDLNVDEQLILMKEISVVSKSLKEYTKADKMNIAIFGNKVSQLHVHIIARFKNDRKWPNCIWDNQLTAVPYSSEKALKFTDEFSKIMLANFL